MKRNCGAILVLRYSVLAALALFLSACATKVIDIDKSVPKLELSEEQAEVVEPKMASIKEIVDTYNSKKEVVEEELSGMMGGGMGGGMRGGGGRSGGDSGRRGELREKMQEFRNQRETYLSAINTHIADIKAVLNEEQLATFERMKQPRLEMLEMPGGRGGRGGMGRGGMGGGKGGGGGRRGGGMF